MLEIKITIEAPDLAKAISSLAAVLNQRQVQTAVPITPALPESAPAQNSTSVQSSAPVQNEVPAQSESPVNVPVAQPPQYTIEQIMQAGATLMDAGKANELIELLRSFGVQAVMDLKQEQLGAFATAMRELGAKI